MVDFHPARRTPEGNPEDQVGIIPLCGPYQGYDAALVAPYVEMLQLEVSYTDDDYPEGIANKDRYIMWYDGIGGFDFDVLQIAYYAGLLGVGPEKLPLKLVQEQKAGKETYRGVDAYSWRLDSNGYPASVTTEYRGYYNGSLEENGSDSTHFSW